MSAQETASMSAWSAPAMVGIETMKMRVATPEKNCPTMALTRSSTSVCLAMRWWARPLSHGPRTADVSCRTRTSTGAGGGGDGHRVHDVLADRPVRAHWHVRDRHRDERDGRRL